MTSHSAELIGRTAELTSCQQLLRTTPPWIGILEGPPGIGKTALWQAAVTLASATGWRVLATRPAERERHLTDRALVEMFSDVTDHELSMLPPPQARAVARLLQRQPGERPDRLTLLFSVRSLVDALAESQARVLLAIDDAQWVDAESRDVFAALVTAARPAPASVLVAARSGAEDSLPFDRARLPIVPTTLALTALDFDASSQLVRSRFGGGWSQTLLHAIWENSAGNPLTVLELARAMSDRRAEPVPVSLPLGGLRDALAHHLDSMPVDGQRAAEIASALSRPTRAEVAQVAASCSIDVDVDAAIDEAVLSPAGPVGALAFAHPLLRTTAYRRMRETQRRAVHAAAAASCDSVSERAWHLAETAQGPDEAIAAALEAAVRELLAAGAPLTAVPLAERTLALTSGTETAHLFRRRLLLVDALHLVSDYVRARRVVLALLDTAAPGRDRAEALWRRAWYVGSERTLQNALDDIHAALRELAWTPESVSGVSAANQQFAVEMLQDYATTLCINRGNGTAALPLAQQAVALANASPDVGLRMQAETILGSLENLLDPPAARARLSRLAEAGDVYDKKNFHAWPQYELGMQAMMQGRLDEARGLLESLVRRLAPTGSVEIQAEADFHVAELAWREGHWDEAYQLASRAINLALDTGDDAAAGYVLALVEACRGETSRALRHARAWKEESLRKGDIMCALRNGWVEGLALLLEGDAAAATVLADLDTLASGYVAIQPHLPDTIEALLLAGRRAEAEERLERLSHAAETIDDHLFAQTTALRCRGLLLGAANDHRAATDVLRDATERARIMDAPLETARTLLAYGGALRRTRHRVEAGAMLQESHDIFARLGAPIWQRRAAEELNRAVPGRDGGLTPTEKAVAKLAANGRTNAQIARELVISVKTVEANLTRIYAKLGVRSRTGLARIDLE